MSFNSRIKERREQLNMSRTELAEKIGVTTSAISNYENAISSPKVELLYRLFDALKCDANYLYQDEMNILVYKNSSTPEEFEKIIKPYRALDPHGQDLVLTVLNKEYQRSTDTKETNKITQLPDRSYLDADAAHDRTDIPDSDRTAASIQAEDDIMDDPNF